MSHPPISTSGEAFQPLLSMLGQDQSTSFSLSWRGEGFLQLKLKAVNSVYLPLVNSIPKWMILDHWKGIP